MEAYTFFAEVYDIFMDETPYEKWCDFLDKVIQKYGISVPKKKEEGALESEKNLVLDLACGTGTLTEMMATKGYDMMGIDCSSSMLQVAVKKREKNQSQVLYLQQDMRELDLYSTVGTVLCVCDSLNYLLTDEDVIKVFQKVNNFLFPGGIFIFDFNTVYKYAEIIGNTTIAENRENCSFIWENYYDVDENLNEYDVTFFVKENSTVDRYRKFNEVHYQRGYTISSMTKLVEKAGLKMEVILDAETLKPCTEYSERVYMVARECHKERI